MRRATRAAGAALSLALVGVGLGVAGSPGTAAADSPPPVVVSPDGALTSTGILIPTGAAPCFGYVIPPGVTQVDAVVRGGAGRDGRSQNGHGGGAGGRGAVVEVDEIPVAPGQRLYTGSNAGGPYVGSIYNPLQEEKDQPGNGGQSAWLAYGVNADCGADNLIAAAGGGGGGGDADWRGPGGTGGNADARGNDGSGSGSSQAGRGGQPGGQSAGGTGGAGGTVPDPTCFCTTRGDAGESGAGPTGGQGGRGPTAPLGTGVTAGGGGGGGYYGGGGGGASHGFSIASDSSGPLAGAGSGGGGGGSSYPVGATFDLTGPGSTTVGDVQLFARWASSTTVTSSSAIAPPGQPVTLTATVSTPNPFGTRFLSGGHVSFSDQGSDPQAGGTPLGDVPVVLGADGRVTASVTVPSLTGGDHIVRAYFFGYSRPDDPTPGTAVLPSFGRFTQQVVSQQTVSFTSTPGAPAAYGDPYAVTASATSGLPVALTVDPSATGVCALDQTSRTVSFLAAGTCVLDADQAGSALFLPAARVQQSFVVADGTPPVQQVITFTSTPPEQPRPGTIYTVSAVGGGSGNPVVFGVDDEGFGSCGQQQLPNDQVAIFAGGPCRIVATQAAGRGYLAASATQEFFIAATPQSIGFRSTPPTALAVGQTYTAVVAVDSRRLATFGTGPGSSGCSVVRTPPSGAGNATTSATVTATGPGTCVVTAQEPTDDYYYSPSPVVSQSFPVGTQQAVSFTSTPPSGAVVGEQYTPTTSGGSSGQPVVLGTTTPLTCTVSGGTARLVGAGVCTLTADQAGTSTVAAAPRSFQSFVVGRGTQTLSFASEVPGGATVGQTYAPSVTGGLSSAALVVGTATPTTCTADGTTVRFTGAGDCVVTADQAGDSNVSAAAQVTQTVPVGRGSQTISFFSSPPSDAVVGGAPYAPGVLAGASTAPVVLGTTTPTVCTVTGATVSFVAAGTCTVTADQAGDTDVTAAPQVTQDVVVGQGSQAVTITSTPPTGAVVSQTYTPAVAAGPSSAPVVLGTTTPAVCTVAGTTVTFTGVGDCVVTADQAGDSSYTAAPGVTQTVAVGAAPQTITITTTPPGAPTTGVAYPLAATATSGLPVTFAGSGPCTVTATGQGTATVTLSGTGACTVTATQPGDATRTAAPPVTQTYQVGATGSSDLRVTLTPSSGVRPAGPQDVTVTVRNTGSRDSGPVTTRLLTSAPVTDTGGATRTGGPLGTSVLTWTSPNVAAGQSATFTVRIEPRAGLAVLGALARGTVPDATPLDDLAVTGLLVTPAAPTTSVAPTTGAARAGTAASTSTTVPTTTQPTTTVPPTTQPSTTEPPTTAPDGPATPAP
ncbi:hypothetical protein GCM10027047_34560 [Rhodococcus aerolatus]